MKTIFTRVRVLGLCLFILNYAHFLLANPTSITNCSTDVLIKQSEGSGGPCPEQPILVINPADLNPSFGQDLLLEITPGNQRIRLDKDANGFTMPIEPGKYTITTSVLGSSNCPVTVQEIEIIQISTLYDIEFTQYEFACEAQASYKVGISPAFDRETFGQAMTITLLPGDRVFEVTETSNAFLLALPAGQYHLISESPTVPNCRRVQQVEVQGSDGADHQAPVFTSTYCGTYKSITTPACFAEIHYLVEATDNCGPVTITNNYNDQAGTSFADLFLLGDHELVFTATDLAGNQSHCTLNFSLSYEGVVNAWCVANTVVTVGNEPKRYLTLDEIAITTPNGEFCDDVFEIDPPFVRCENVGTQLVKVFQKGNPSPLCETTIEVEPTYEFALSCRENYYTADENRNGECGAEVLVELEFESSGCEQDIEIRNDYNAETGMHFTDFFPVGAHEITFYLEKNGALITTCTTTVIVEEDPTGLACLAVCLPEENQDGCTYEFNAANESWKLGSKENAFLAQEDDITFLSFPMIGDGSIVARVSQMSSKARAGVMMRESCDPGSRFIAALVKPFSRNAYQRHRSEFNATAQQLQKRLSGGYPKWVKLKRQGNSFYSYASTNGYSWKLLFKTTLPMGEQMQWGLMVESSVVNTYATATFEGIQFNGELVDQLAAQGPDFRNNFIGEPQLDSPTQQESALAIFPNPVQGPVNLMLPDWEGQTGTLEVLDMNAKVIWRTKIGSVDGQSRRLDWGAFSPGIYIIALKGEGQITATQRIVIQP